MGNAFLLIIAGLLLFYVVITDKWYCIEGALGCLAGKHIPANTEPAGRLGVALPVPGVPSIPKVPELPTASGVFR